MHAEERRTYLQKQGIEMKKNTTSTEKWKLNGYRKESKAIADLF